LTAIHLLRASLKKTVYGTKATLVGFTAFTLATLAGLVGLATFGALVVGETLTGFANTATGVTTCATNDCKFIFSLLVNYVSIIHYYQKKSSIILDIFGYKVLDFWTRKSIMEPRHTCAEHTQKKRGILSDTP
jgi:hypothetical protein